MIKRCSILRNVIIILCIVEWMAKGELIFLSGFNRRITSETNKIISLSPVQSSFEGHAFIIILGSELTVFIRIYLD